MPSARHDHDGSLVASPLEDLVAAIWRTPIPTAPAPAESHSEGRGLTWLALALRLEHIDRMSESLVLVDSTHMARRVALDLNLSAITQEQKLCLSTDPSHQKPTHIWLPIARQARRDLSPVILRDATGHTLPRLTNLEGAGSLSQGLARLFRMFLDADPRTEGDGELLRDIKHDLNRSRWLIEAAITSLVAEGATFAPRTAPRRGSRQTDSGRIRGASEEAVRALFPQDSPFLRLLSVASSEHLLIAQVPLANPSAFISYEAPLIPARRRVRRLQATIPVWAPLDQEFTVQYRTIIPRAVNSYHVTVEVPDEIQVRRLLLTSDADAPAADQLIRDMTDVADRFDHLLALSPKLLELELQSLGSRMAEFGRRRARDLFVYQQYIQECYAAFSQRRPLLRRAPKLDGGGSVLSALASRRQVVGKLLYFADEYESDVYRRMAEGAITAAQLRAMAGNLEHCEIGIDVSVDNDPRENAGHAHWRRRPFDVGPQSVEPVSAWVFVALVDDPPSLASNVSRLLVAVLVLVVGFATVLEPGLLLHVPLLGRLAARVSPPIAPQGEDQPLNSADAIVTMLLLVPGLLLSRLDIPSHTSVLGQLRLLPRYVAYLSVGVTSTLAIAVAGTRAGTLRAAFTIAIAALAFLLLVTAGDGLLKAVKRRALVPNFRPTPRWLIYEVRRLPRIRRRRCTVEFATAGRDSRV